MGYYQFECETHGRFETYQGITEDHTEVCPVCKKYAKRIYSSPIVMGDLPAINKMKSIESENKMMAESQKGV